MSGMKMSHHMHEQVGILAAAGLSALVLENACDNPTGRGTTVIPVSGLDYAAHSSFAAMEPGVPMTVSGCKVRSLKKVAEGRHRMTRTTPIRKIAFGDSPDAMEAAVLIEDYACSAKELAGVALALLHLRSETPTQITISMKDAARRIFGDTPKPGSLGSRLLQRTHGYVSITR